jgi:hypothetical protein
MVLIRVFGAKTRGSNMRMGRKLQNKKLHNLYSSTTRVSNENRKTEIKIRNIGPLSYKLADMLPML